MKFQQFLTKHLNQITLISGILIAIAFLDHWTINNDMIYQSTLIIASILSGVPIIMRAISALKSRVISIELLVSVAVIGAFIIGEYNESAMVTFLFLFGSFLEQKTLEKTRRSIQNLTDLNPTQAILLEDGVEKLVDVDDLDEGDHILVKAGSKIPVDGKLFSGQVTVNEAAITGESRLVKKVDTDAVYSGTLVDNGSAVIEATAVGDDTTFSKIIELIEDAQDTKSQSEKFIDRFAKYYTPLVLIIAAVIFFATRDFKLAITVLVLGCPGALVIGAPVSNVAGIGSGAKQGILIKGGDVMDTFAKVDTIMFDKTGTLTNGEPSVTEVESYVDDAQTEKMVAIAGKIEQLSDHPLAQAIVSYRPIKDEIKVTNHETIKGQGVLAKVDGQTVALGNAKLMDRVGVDLTTDQKEAVAELASQQNSIVLMAIDDQLKLIIGVADAVRTDAKDALDRLRQQGIKHFVMLTGDNLKTAQAVANTLGIDEVKADLMPADKVDVIKAAQANGQKVAFVGDGINDGPSIATADIGIAMGSGTSVAIETSDVVLMQSQLSKLADAYALTKHTVANMTENITIAIGTVAFLLIGLLAGFIYMASGMLIHEASILVVIFNAMRLLKINKKNQITASTKMVEEVK